MKLPSFFLVGVLPSLALAQWPPVPTDVTVVSSVVDSDVKISYKNISICETSARAYSGFVHMPANTTEDVGGFDISTYFLYFEAREQPETAPVAIYLAGGPGEASSYAAFAGESGPCVVNVWGNGTTNNPWSFTGAANVLYIDQPVQAGFSYSDLITGTLDLTTQVVTPANFSDSDPVPASNATFGAGVFAGQDLLLTTNTTVASGRAITLFAEHWFSSFPGYHETTESPRVSVWGNSYGGFWVPEVAAQLHKFLADLCPEHPLGADGRGLVVDVIGITNGCIDLPTAMVGWPEFAYNNTYDVQFIPEELYLESIENITMPGGCLDQAQQCRDAGREGDPYSWGNNLTVNALCEAGFVACETIVGVLNALNNVSAFDVAIASPDTCSYYVPVSTYLNRADVLAELGVPLNWTWDSATVSTVFGLAALAGLDSSPSDVTGDSLRQDGLSNLAYLLNSGVQAALIYGDRDYRCPWTGAETTALAAVWPGQSDFAGAGYTALAGLPADAKGAVVKQFGPLSFTRVFDSGHQVSAYAPEAVLTVFNRTLAGLDVATGTAAALPDWRTDGPTDSYGWRNTMPSGWPIENTCITGGQFLSENPWDLLGTS